LNDSALTRFFGVVARPQTWLGILFQWLAFPLGLFYFVFLTTGLSLGIGLVVVWVGIPILLVVAGAWWLFGAFERLQAHYLLGADVPPAPREWEKVEGVWGKLKAHFGGAATWKDLLYLLAKIAFGTVSTVLLVTAVSMVFWFLAIPVFAIFDVPLVNGTWVPPLWFGVVSVPLGILVFFVSLHVLNGWSWVCARWAEVMFRGPLPRPAAFAPPAAAPAAGSPAAVLPPPPAAMPPQAPPAPPQPPAAPVAASAAPPAPPVPPPAPAPAVSPGPPVPGGTPSEDETTS
jgi:hypothetical protein